MLEILVHKNQLPEVNSFNIIQLLCINPWWMQNVVIS